MLGNDNPVATITDGLPDGWYACHYPDRRQPYTLQRRLDWKNDRHHLAYETVFFCTTITGARAVAERVELREKEEKKEA